MLECDIVGKGFCLVTSSLFNTVVGLVPYPFQLKEHTPCFQKIFKKGLKEVLFRS